VASSSPKLPAWRLRALMDVDEAVDEADEEDGEEDKGQNGRGVESKGKWFFVGLREIKGCGGEQV